MKVGQRAEGVSDSGWTRESRGDCGIIPPDGSGRAALWLEIQRRRAAAELVCFDFQFLQHGHKEIAER